MKLTNTFAERKQGNGKVQKHSDGGGLFLYITPTGKKSWRLAYRFLGKQKLLVIGPYPAISLKEARERREAAKKLLVDNIDPSVAKQTAKAAAANAAEILLSLLRVNGGAERYPVVGSIQAQYYRSHGARCFWATWKTPHQDNHRPGAFGCFAKN